MTKCVCSSGTPAFKLGRNDPVIQAIALRGRSLRKKSKAGSPPPKGYKNDKGIKMSQM